jgi:hypothetical protein
MTDIETTQQQIYTAFAENYCSFKKKTLLNILNCGRILCEAKEHLGFGEFTNFLDDSRVNESERTAQRLMAVYRDYRHILSNNTKIDALRSLGISHLLELRKLPDRFKKEIELVKDVEGKEVKEMISVVDEDKLNDFLERRVPTEDGSRPIRDLSLNEMKKYINEASGVYELSKKEHDKEMQKSEEEIVKENVEESIVPSDDSEESQKLADAKIAETTERILTVLTQLGDIYAMSTQAIQKVPEIKPEDTYSNGELIRTKLKVQLEQAVRKSEELKSVCEDLLYKLK